MDWLLLGIRISVLVLVVFGLTGSLLATYALGDYISDRIDLGEINGDYRMTAAIGIRTSAMVMVIFLLFLATGIFGLYAPPPVPDREMRALVSGLGLDAIVITLWAMKLLNLRDRIRLRLHGNVMVRARAEQRQAMSAPDAAAER